MFDRSSLHHVVRDVQYQTALGSSFLGSPDTLIPPPTLAQLELIKSWDFDLDSVLNSPIGLYFFRKYLKRFLNMTSTLDFLEDYKRSEHVSEGTLFDLQVVVDAMEKLPSQFRKEVSEVQKKVIKLINEDDTDSFSIVDIFGCLHSSVKLKLLGFFSSFSESPEYGEMKRVFWYSQQPVGPDHFRKYRVLGRGAFGSVLSVKHKVTGQLAAMKLMGKQAIMEQKMLPYVKGEKEVLQMLGNDPSPFAIWLKYAFDDEDYFYMALPLCTGGDLSYHLDNEGPFSIERATFYAAEIFDGLTHLHKLGVLYRDMKPANVMLASDGHCLIGDMGLAVITDGKRILGKAGTPGYWAPEILNKQPYGFKSDYWSFAVVLFEFLIGMCPFTTRNTGMSRDRAVKEWTITFPSYLEHGRPKKMVAFPDDAIDLLLRLLERSKPQKRLSERRVRNHPFFKNINWDLLRQKKLRPPFIPSEKKINAVAAKHLQMERLEKNHKKSFDAAKSSIFGFDFTAMKAHETDICNALEQHEKTDGMIFESGSTKFTGRPTSIRSNVRKSTKRTNSIRSRLFSRRREVSEFT